MSTQHGNYNSEGMAPSSDSANESSSLTCPTCWGRFELSEILSIATHDALRGDSILGPEAMLRFEATRHDDRGRVLDSKGCVCPALACPHCRRKLPSGFCEQPHHIFSIVGEQSSGKSYYLAVLSKKLPEALLKSFGVSFTDADPTGNLALNGLREKLFSAKTPDQAVFAKTQLTGEMYEKIQLADWPEPLMFPKPFVYTAQKANGDDHGFSVIFYDNGGEYFRPDKDIVSHPGAKHVAFARGILFLFDPFHSPGFRKRMDEDSSKDPQMTKPILDQQGVLLATMRNRIQTIHGMLISEKIETPLSIVVGKCDAWQHFLVDNHWSNPIHDNTLDLTAIGRNSDIVRQLLMELCPEIVANAEAISHNVCYFAASSFGHVPLESSVGQIAPDPTRLKPLMTEIPPLWLLSQTPDTCKFVPGRFAPPQEEPQPTTAETAPAVTQSFDFKSPCTPIVSELNKLICAYLVAGDGCLSAAEERWLEENIGSGSTEEIVEVVENHDYKELPDQIARMTSKLQPYERAWLLNAKSAWSQLAHCDDQQDADLQAFEWVCAQIT